MQEQRRILLVDDHVAVRHGLALVLAEEGVGECCEAEGRDEALAAGARGYITKREAPRELAHAVRDVLEGWTLISPRAAEGLR